MLQICFLFPNSLWDIDYFYPYFTNDKNMNQREINELNWSCRKWSWPGWGSIPLFHFPVPTFMFYLPQNLNWGHTSLKGLPDYGNPEKEGKDKRIAKGGGRGKREKKIEVKCKGTGRKIISGNDKSLSSYILYIWSIHIDRNFEEKV